MSNRKAPKPANLDRRCSPETPGLTDITLPAGTKPTIGDSAFQGVSASAIKVLSKFDFGGFTASCSSGLTLT